MTIQLIQTNQFDAQIKNECFSIDSDKLSLRKRKKILKINENDYFNVNEKEPNPKQDEHRHPIYSLILKFILFMIKFHLYLKINLIYLYYSICLAIDRWSDADYHFIEFYSNKFKQMSIQIPKHVCVITNDDLSESKAISLFCTIIDSLSVYGVEAITFYQFKSISSNIKNCLNKKYFLRDENNNFSKNYKKNFNINFLSIESGGNCLVANACKSIATKILNNQIELQDVSQDLVDSQVIGNFVI